MSRNLQNMNRQKISDLIIWWLTMLFQWILVQCVPSFSNNGYYIAVRDPYNTFNWFEAKDYCMANYGSSLASIHSASDENNLENVMIATDGDTDTWIGLNDISKESRLRDESIINNTWKWSDGTEYDYQFDWSGGNPDNWLGR